MSNNKLDNIITSLENLSKRISNIESNLSKRKPEILVGQVCSKAVKVKNESFMEFFKKFNPKKETDKTLIIMYFLESRRDIVNITTKDIAVGYKEIREKAPTNIPDKIQMLHKKGLVMPGEIIDKLKGWVITRSGLDYLEELKNEN